MKGEAQQSLLAARADQGRDIEERRWQDRASAQDPDLAALLHDEEPAVSGVLYAKRAGKPLATLCRLAVNAVAV